LNLKRHACGGRNFEYFSEDPLLSGTLAASFIQGVQETNQVAACPKHFCVNNQETHRFVVNALVDPRTCRELYYKGFEIVVKESQPATIMCAYNKVNGIYASEHPFLLTQLLREEWGFGGICMTDWGATHDRAAGIAAGMDLEMPGELLYM
jgi:beta-glucosidase